MNNQQKVELLKEMQSYILALKAAIDRINRGEDVYFCVTPAVERHANFGPLKNKAEAFLLLTNQNWKDEIEQELQEKEAEFEAIAIGIEDRDGDGKAD